LIHNEGNKRTGGVAAKRTRWTLHEETKKGPGARRASDPVEKIRARKKNNLRVAPTALYYNAGGTEEALCKDPTGLGSVLQFGGRTWGGKKKKERGGGRIPGRGNGPVRDEVGGSR